MTYKHVNANERHTLMYLLQMNLSFREIGRRLGKDHSTISREVKRNGRLFGCYCGEAAQKISVERKKEPRHLRKYANDTLKNYVITHLKMDWSPETISGRLAIDFRQNTDMQISPETIYQWVYNDAGEGGTLYRHLIRRHRKRRKQQPYGGGRGFIPGRVNIAERAASIENRNRFGHWEGDSVLGAKGSGGIATHVERKSKLLVAAKLKDQRSDTFTAATTIAFSVIPSAWKKTLTVDNGKEFSDFKSIEKITQMKVYFCDPYSPWQRGTNENTNGLLRHYFPKGTDWRKVTDKELATAVRKLNNRPRKRLNYQTPSEVFLKSTGGALTN